MLHTGPNTTTDRLRRDTRLNVAQAVNLTRSPHVGKSPCAVTCVRFPRGKHELKGHRKVTFDLLTNSSFHVVVVVVVVVVVSVSLRVFNETS